MQALIHAGRLPSLLYGRDHGIKKSDLALVAERKTGRPSKMQAAPEGDVSTTTVAPEDAMPAAVTGKKKPAKKAQRRGTAMTDEEMDAILNIQLTEPPPRQPLAREAVSGSTSEEVRL